MKYSDMLIILITGSRVMSDFYYCCCCCYFCCYCYVLSMSNLALPTHAYQQSHIHIYIVPQIH